MRKILLILFVQLSILSCKKDYLESKFKLTNSASYYPNNEWKNEFNYKDTNLFNISLEEETNIPEIMVEFDNELYPLTFDFGNSKDILITTALENEINYTTIKESETWWPDGSFRGYVYVINIPKMKLLNIEYLNVPATLADWKIYSSNPFNGCVSMDYFSDLRFTLDYKQKILACSNQTFTYDSSTDEYLIINLIKFDYHPYGVHFMGEVNNVKSLIYFDTGRSKTMIKKGLVDPEKVISDKTGTFYNGVIPVKFDQLKIELQFPRVDDLDRGIDYDYPVGIAVGSDILQYFVITIDRTENNDKLIVHK